LAPRGVSSRAGAGPGPSQEEDETGEEKEEGARFLQEEGQEEEDQGQKVAPGTQHALILSPGHSSPQGGGREEVKVKGLHEKEYGSVEEMRGVMSCQKVAEPAAFERANYLKVLASYRLLP
jgi:hypothetical protein